MQPPAETLCTLTRWEVFQTHTKTQTHNSAQKQHTHTLSVLPLDHTNTFSLTQPHECRTYTNTFYKTHTNPFHMHTYNNIDAHAHTQADTHNQWTHLEQHLSFVVVLQLQAWEQTEQNGVSNGVCGCSSYMKPCKLYPSHYHTNTCTKIQIHNLSAASGWSCTHPPNTKQCIMVLSTNHICIRYSGHLVACDTPTK